MTLLQVYNNIYNINNNNDDDNNDNNNDNNSIYLYSTLQPLCSMHFIHTVR